MVSMKQIRSVAREIGRKFEPDKIILFGSHARGDANEDSDVDLLVVMNVRGKPEYKSVEIGLSVDIPFPADILVRDPEEIRRRIGWNDFFLKDIMEQGKVLYESGHRGVDRKGRGRLHKSSAGTARPQPSKS